MTPTVKRRSKAWRNSFLLYVLPYLHWRIKYKSLVTCYGMGRVVCRFWARPSCQLLRRMCGILSSRRWNYGNRSTQHQTDRKHQNFSGKPVTSRTVLKDLPSKPQLHFFPDIFVVTLASRIQLVLNFCSSWTLPCWTRILSTSHIGKSLAQQSTSQKAAEKSLTC